MAIRRAFRTPEGRFCIEKEPVFGFLLVEKTDADGSRYVALRPIVGDSITGARFVETAEDYLDLEENDRVVGLLHANPDTFYVGAELPDGDWQVLGYELPGDDEDWLSRARQRWELKKKAKEREKKGSQGQEK